MVQYVAFNVVTSPEDVEGIDSETSVSKAEWCSAMLTVGICRAAALESFDCCLKDVGAEEGAELTLLDLASELNGVGRVAGVEELRSAVGKVKKGKAGESRHLMHIDVFLNIHTKINYIYFYYYSITDIVYIQIFRGNADPMSRIFLDLERYRCLI